MTHQAQSRNLTDRAHRYRANANPPPGEKRCCLCGSQHQVMVGHVNGREEDSGPENLFWTCRSCNSVCANSLKRAGLGRPTNQYNPAAKGAQSLGQWMNAISSMKSEGGTMTVRDAVAMIRATSPEDRSRFARDIWQRRRMHRNSGLNASKKNPAVNGPQYRFAQAVAHGTARKTTRMTKTVARELIAATPASQRSKFERSSNLFGKKKPKKLEYDVVLDGRVLKTFQTEKAAIAWMKRFNERHPKTYPNPKIVRNLFGFGKSKDSDQESKRTLFGKRKVTFSSKLMEQSYNRGFYDRGSFDSWINTQKDLSNDFKNKLRAKYDQGVTARERDQQKKEDRRRASEERQDEIKRRRDELRILALERKRLTPPPLPASERRKAKKGGGSNYYKGRTIREKDYKFYVGGYDFASLKDAKKFVDYDVAAGGKLSKLRNPEWSLHQGNSLAIVYETKTNQHTAEVYNSTTGKSQSETFTGPKSFRSAVTWARVMLHEVASPNPKARAYPRGKAKRNPIDIAEKQFEYFHGAPSKEVLEFQEQEHRHSVLWAIGPLIGIVIRNTQGTKDIEILAPDPETASLTDIVMLCCSEDGRQLFTVGGNQLLKLKEMGSFGITPEDVRDHMLIGTIIQITYRTKKSFEKHGKEEVDFFHDLGKEGSRGVCPVLEYKPRNPSMEIVGGRYEIAKPEAALGGVSPGIVG